MDRQESGPSDARAHIVHPTERARELRTEVPRLLNTHFAPIREVLGSGDEEELLRLVKNLRRRFGDDV